MVRSIPPLPTLRELLKVLNLKACKQLSQNFLLQPAPIQKIVNSAGNLENSFVLEVGPGIGSLTREIIKHKPFHLSVVELDRRFLVPLENLKKYTETQNIKLDVYNQDILKFNVDNIFPNFSEIVHEEQAWCEEDIISAPENQKRIHIIGNLPFNISTPLLSQWLHDISERRGLWRYARVPLVLTFQEAVGYRLKAHTNDNERCRFSILSNSVCQVSIVGKISGRTFYPPAKVDTIIVELKPRLKPLINVPYPFLEKLVKHIFQYKNKMIYHGVASLFPPDKLDLVIRMFHKTLLSPELYPIEVSIEDAGKLATEYYQICKENNEIYSYDYRARVKYEKLSPTDLRKLTLRKVVGKGVTFNHDYIQNKVNQLIQEEM